MPAPSHRAEHAKVSNRHRNILTGRDPAIEARQLSCCSVLHACSDRTVDREGSETALQPVITNSMSYNRDPWLRMHGMRRITAEFKHVSNLIREGRLPQLSNLHLPTDDMFQWRVHVSGFDESSPAGAAVNRDLQKLQSSGGQGFMVMELLFPEDEEYPTTPFFLRILTPRCQMYTGHVTAGGSICIQVRRVP